MARPSKVEHLREKAYELFRQGLTPREVRDRYPEIPLATVYVWRNQALEKEPGSRTVLEPISDSRKESTEPSAVVQVEVVDEGDRLSPKLAVLPGREESDYQLGRRVAREVARTSKSDYARILAVNTLAKLIEMKLSMPSALLDGAEEKPLKDEVRGARSQSPEDLQQQFKDLLENTG